MVAGDGANDLPMFFGAGRERGVIVGNAEEVRENTTRNSHPLVARPLIHQDRPWIDLLQES